MVRRRRRRPNALFFYILLPMRCDGWLGLRSGRRALSRTRLWDFEPELSYFCHHFCKATTNVLNLTVEQHTGGSPPHRCVVWSLEYGTVKRRSDWMAIFPCWVPTLSLFHVWSVGRKVQKGIIVLRWSNSPNGINWSVVIKERWFASCGWSLLPMVTFGRIMEILKVKSFWAAFTSANKKKKTILLTNVWKMAVLGQSFI